MDRALGWLGPRRLARTVWPLNSSIASAFYRAKKCWATWVVELQVGDSLCSFLALHWVSCNHIIERWLLRRAFWIPMVKLDVGLVDMSSSGNIRSCRHYLKCNGEYGDVFLELWCDCELTVHTPTRRGPTLVWHHCIERRRLRLRVFWLGRSSRSKG